MGTHTTYEEKRKIIESSQVYGLYHEQQQKQNLIYVGETTDHLKRRLDFHRSAARKGEKSSLYSYIREEVDEPRQDLDIEALPYGDEQAAIDAHDGLLNDRDAGDGCDVYDWSDEELQILKESSSLREAAEKTGANYNQCRSAKLKLSWIGYTRYDAWTDEEIELLGTDDDKKVAEQIGRSEAAVCAKRWKLGIEPTPPERALDKTEVIELYLEYSLGTVTQGDLAERYGVSSTLIGQIVRQEASAYEDIDYEALDDTIADVEALTTEDATVLH